VRTIGFVLVMVACVASVAGAVYSAPCLATPQQAFSSDGADAVRKHSREAEHVTPKDEGMRVGKPSDEQQSHPKVTANKLATSKPSTSKSNRPSESSNRRERSASEGSTNSDHTGSVKPEGPVENGSTRDETINRPPSNKAPRPIPHSVSSLSNVRQSGANPAIVGGAGNSNTRNTMALDGTHMSHKRTGN
jgi:hypothetical protein